MNYFDPASIIIYLLICLIFLKVIYRINCKKNNIAILALSDLGLCPRMQNHATSASRCFPERNIFLIGYSISPFSSEITYNPNIQIFHIPGNAFLEAFKMKTRNIMFPIYAALKITLQITLLFITLMKIPHYGTLLVQNPPTIPTLFVSWLACRLRGAKFLIDWHNYGFSLLQITLSSIKAKLFSPLINFSSYFERFWGLRADHSFCVSKTMQLDLSKNWSITSDVLYDRPSELIKPISLIERHILNVNYLGHPDTDPDSLSPPIRSSRSKMSNYLEFLEASNVGSHLKSSEIFKKNIVDLPKDKIMNFANFEEVSLVSKVSGKLQGDSISFHAKVLPMRPAVLLSSTSWTKDENLEILLHSLKLYDTLKTQHTTSKILPNLIVIITGKNPDKFWLNEFHSMKMKHVKLFTLFVPMEDYYKLVASSDIGISLHTSSSGLDLPMKIVDMQGAGTPVLAFYFQTIEEQVLRGKNAFTFTSSKELTERLVMVLEGFPMNFDNAIKSFNLEGNSHLYTLRKFAEENRPNSFFEEWKKIASPYFI